MCYYTQFLLIQGYTLCATKKRIELNVSEREPFMHAYDAIMQCCNTHCVVKSKTYCKKNLTTTRSKSFLMFREI